MDTFARLPAAEREKYFREAAARMGLPPFLMEKDFWVCWTLKRLFSLESVTENLLFKGGTSLSKVYRVIRRFSEDIDVSIRRDSLGFGGEADPANPELSGKAQRRQEKALAEAAKSKITHEILPELKEMIARQAMKEEWTLTEDPSEPDQQSLVFAYPRTSLTQTATAYLLPTVKIEFGARSDHWPAEIKVVQPYLAETIPHALHDANIQVKAMDVRRTFWEKATILHQMAHLPHDKGFPSCYSRHYCDTAEMITSKVADAAARDEELLKAVVAHKQTFFRSAWANYATATKGTLRLLPPEERLPDLRKDLASMREMFFDAPPELNQVLRILRGWESAFNAGGK
jgi:Nucleotidyl transferase AbiEii toxin, Type IV TA system